MADEDLDVILRLKAVDETGRVLSDAVRNAKSVSDQMVRGMSDIGRAAAESSKYSLQLTQGMTSAGQATERFAGATKAASSVVNVASTALHSYAGQFLSVVGAMEAARRGIVSFAESSRVMERIQLSSGATTKQIEGLSASFEHLAGVTGHTANEIGRAFNSFSSQSGMALGPAAEAFDKVVLAAHAANVEIGTMSRAAITALTNMKVPAEELGGVLSTWATTLPREALEVWSEAGPRITSMLRTMGFTGARSAEQAAAAFGDLTQKMGSTRVAASTLEGILGKAKDVNTTLGMMSTQLIDNLKNDPDKINKLMSSVYENAKGMGLFDPNISSGQRSLIQNWLQLDDREVQGLQHIGERLEKINKVAKDLHVSFDVVNKTVTELNKGPQAAVDRLAAAMSALWDRIGATFGVAVPDELGKYIQGLVNDLDRGAKLLREWRELIGARDKETGEETPRGGYNLDKLIPGKTIFGTQVPGGPARGPGEGPELPPAERQRIKDEKRILLDRIKKEGLVPHATGGEFTVPGSGRGDDQPVSFMGTPGERVTIESVPAADTKESLQRQQDKADLALQEHFARFRGKSHPGAQLGSGWPHDRLASLGGSPGSSTGDTGGGGSPGSGSGDGKTSTGDGPAAPGTPAGPPTSGPGYNIGPYGQPMPAWGEHVTEGEDWGGGTGGGVAGGVPGLPGGPSGRALTKEERAAMAGGAGAGSGGQAAYLAQHRAAIIAELKDPAKREKFMGLVQAEVGNDPKDQQAFIETTIDRWAARKQTVAQGTASSYFGKNPRYRTPSAATTSQIPGLLDGAAAGSALFPGATGNASAGVLADHIKRGELAGQTRKGGEGFIFEQADTKFKQAVLGASKTGPGAGPAVAGTSGSGSGSAALDDALKIEGLHEVRDREAVKAYLNGWNPVGRDNAWCARFINSALQHTGGKGTGSELAASFKNWGEGVKGAPQAGDVMVVGDHHVGFATGRTMTKNGQLYYEMYSGNTSDMAKKDWRLASGLTVRRGTEAELGKTRLAGPAPTPDTAAPPTPATPYVPGRTQGLPGSPSGPAVKRDRPAPPPSAPTSVPATPTPAQSAASAARRSAAAKRIAAATPKPAPAPVARQVSAPGHEDTASGKGRRPASELAEGGTAGAGQDVLVGEDGPEVLSMGPRSGTVHHPGTGYTGPGAEFPEGHDPRAAGLQPGGVGPFGSDFDMALGFIPSGPASSAGKAVGGWALGKLGGVAGKFAGGQVEHQITREGIAAGGGVLGAHRQFEDRLDLLKKGSSGSQIQPIDQANQDMRNSLGATIEPIIRPRIQNVGPLSMRWTRQSERQRHQDISRDQARAAPVDQGFA